MAQASNHRFASYRFNTLLLGLLCLFAGLLTGLDLEGADVYPNPGIVAHRAGKWVGSDHLYNLSHDIDVVVEIYKPESLSVPFTEEMIRARISDIFKKGGIRPEAEGMFGKPPLPFFHMLIMIYPVGKEAIAAFCDGRLFESIRVERIILDDQTVMQGITWESQNIIVSSPADLADQLYKSIDEIANTFVDRFQFYENIRSEIQK